MNYIVNIPLFNTEHLSFLSRNEYSRWVKLEYENSSNFSFRLNGVFVFNHFIVSSFIALFQKCTSGLIIKKNSSDQLGQVERNNEKIFFFHLYITYILIVVPYMRDSSTSLPPTWLFSQQHSTHAYIQKERKKIPRIKTAFQIHHQVFS